MNKWLNQFLEKPDISDTLDSRVNMSDLSGCPQGLLTENLGNMSETGPDISDRFDSTMNVSGLSGRPRGGLDTSLENMSRASTDNTDGLDSKTNVSVLSVSPEASFGENSHFYTFEERLAIAEHDGQQAEMQAQRIAYLDAFVSVLVTLTQEGFLKNSQRDWLESRIREAKCCLSDKGLEQPE